MAQLTASEIANASASDAPNTPLAIPGERGVCGTQIKISSEEATVRRRAMADMMEAGDGFDAIAAGFERTMGLTRSQVRHIQNEVRSMWNAEDADEKSYRKSTSIRRHRKHIKAAAKDRQWNAVAGLEKNLAAIEGTNEPIEVAVIATSDRVSDAMVRVLGTLSESDLLAVVKGEQDRRLRSGAIDAPVLDAEPVHASSYRKSRSIAIRGTR